MAYRTMVGNLFQPLQQRKIRGTLTLCIKKKRLHQRSDGKILVPGMIKHPPRRIVNTAVSLAFATPDAVVNLF